MADIKESLISAIDILVKNSIDKISADKTIKAVIKQNVSPNKYKYEYNNGFGYAYAQNDRIYSANDYVYVLIPEGDYSNKKIIIGLADVNDESSTKGESALGASINDYNILGTNIISDNSEFGLKSKLVRDQKVVYATESSELFEYIDEESPLSINVSELENNLKKAEKLMIRADFRTKLDANLATSMSGRYALKAILKFKDTLSDDENAVKYISYPLNSESMIGNPLKFSTKTPQYEIFDIDTENFICIDSIIFESSGFVSNSQTKAQNDIFVSDIAINLLNSINATDGDNKLTISTPYGNSFTKEDSKDKLTIRANFIHKNTDISSNVVFYWAKENPTITK